MSKYKTCLRLFIFLLVMIFLPGIGTSQMSYYPDTIQIDEVVVTGSPILINKKNVPMAVSVVTRAQINESDESAILSILNGRVPGLFVTERGITGFGVAQGSAGQISIRGIGGSPTTGVLMLIDGHPQFMGIMGHPLPDSYVASDVERVEVIRGPASILYGSNAMGGAINIITKKNSEEGLHGSVRATYGSYNTQKYMGSAGLKKDKLSLYMSGNHDRTDGHREHSDFKITNGYFKLGYDLSDHFYVTADLSLAGYKAKDPGPDTLNASVGKEIDIQRGYWAITLQNEFDKASGSLKLFHNFGEHKISDGFHSNDHNYGLNFHEAFQLFEGNNLSLGIDYMNYGGLAENTKARGGEGILFADTSIHEFGAYAFFQQLIAESLTVNAGLRYQNNSVYGDQWIPSAGFAYAINKSFNWKGSVSKGFRSPTMRELFMWNPNPNLDPESVISYETGISSVFFNNNLTAEVTLYRVQGNNLIVFIPMHGYSNSGEIDNKGVEFSINATPLERLELNATYSYTNMDNPVYATPEHHLFLNASYRFKKLQLSTSLQQVSNLDNDASPAVNLESYTLLNAKASYNLNRYLKLFISGENLLGTEYEVIRYYGMPKATVLGGLNFIF